MDIFNLRNKYRSDFLPLNIQKFASGNIQEVVAPWTGSSYLSRARFNGSYTQNLDEGTTTITVNCYVDLYSAYALGDVNGTYRFYLNSGAGAWFNQYFTLAPVWYSTGYYSRYLKSDSRTINCGSDGKFNQYNLQAYGELNVDESVLGSVTDTSINFFPTIPAKIGNISNFNSNSTISIPINRFSNDYTKKLIISIGNTIIKEINNITSSDVTLNDGTGTLQVTLSSSEKNIIYNNSLTTNTPTIKFKLETYSNNELYYSSETTATCTLQDVNPVISDVTYSNNTSSIGGDNVIANTSNITITCNLQLKNNATLTSLKCNGQNMTLVSGSQYTVTLNNQNIGTFTIEAIDSRTNRTTSTITKTLINYVQLSQTATFKRVSNTSGKVLLDYSGNYWTGNFGITSNSLSICWNYRVRGSSTWIDGTCIANPTIDTTNFKYNGSSISLNTLLGVNDNFFDYTKDYEFLLTVEDEIQEISIIYSLSKGIPNTAWYEDGCMTHDGDIDITGQYLKNGQPFSESLPLGTIVKYDGNTVPDGYERVDELPEYSTDETICGTWIDGKPIYRRIVSGNRSGQAETSISYSNWNVDELVDIKPIIYSNNNDYYYNSPYYANSDDYWRIYTNLNYKNININCGSNYPGRTGKYILVIEYTKSS